MRKLLFIYAALFLSSLHCFADSDYTAQWQKANTLYEQKQYDSAAFYYEQMAAQKSANPEVYYNLGNAYYRMNKIGFAVLNYERALKIKPEYPEAHDNLLLAQNRITNNINAVGDIFFIRWWNAITAPRNATLWAVLSLVTFLAAIGILLVKVLRKVSISGGVLATLVGALCCLLILGFFSARNGTERSGAVVLESDAPLMNRDLKGKPLMLVPEGTVVKIEDEQNGWLEVKLPNGREGWLQQNTLGRI